MKSTRLQASGVSMAMSTGYTCIAYTESGTVCGRPATVVDAQRGGMVCGVHAPHQHHRHEVTRSFLAKAEEILQQAAEHARKETKRNDVAAPIIEVAIKVRRIRFGLEGGGQ